MDQINAHNSSSLDPLQGLSERHVAQIIRRKMIQRNHGNKRKYDRKRDRNVDRSLE